MSKIYYKSLEEIELIRESSLLVSKTLAEVAKIIKPGLATSTFIDDVISKITFPGSLFLATIAILPSLAVKFGIQQEFAHFFGGTSLLILVGVVLDTLQQIESYLLMRHYDGLMKTGRVTGRTGIPAAGGSPAAL